jgi:hypothetical protein
VAANPERAAHSTLTRYMNWLRDERGMQFADYAELWNWSVEELEEFWASLVEFFKVRFSEGGTTVLGERSMPGAQWFGAAVESWDPDGKPLIDDVGELVITQPMPSLPIFLWGDEDGLRLIDSYYSMYTGIWRGPEIADPRLSLSR